MSRKINLTREEINAAIVEFKQRVAKEASKAQELFTGLGKKSPPDSAKLAAFYKKNDVDKVVDINGHSIEYPSVSQLEQYCTEHGVKFFDLDFPPVDAALYRMKNAADEKPESKRVPVIWKRPDEFFTAANIKLFEKIDPNDIKQGQLGDCWLMSSLSSLSEFPALVEGLFVGEHDRYSEHGVYQVRIYKEGIEKIIYLDDYFPCTVNGGPIYSKANGQELWVMLLEKVFAKCNGSYASIEAGKPFEALIDLTGCPWYEYRFSDRRVQQQVNDGTLFEKLSYYDIEGFIMTLSTPGKDTATLGDRSGGPASGILPGHAYTLSSALTLSNGVQLVRARNPWGNFEWTGDWSDHSELWTDDLKEEVIAKGFTFEKANDGAFWIPFDAVVKYFTTINVALAYNSTRFHDTPKVWNTARKAFAFRFEGSDSHGLNSSIYKLNVHESGKFFFSVHQKDRRAIGSAGYFDFGVTILKRNDFDDSQYTFIGSTGFSVERQLQTEIDYLESGTYYLVPISTGTKIKQYRDAAGSTRSTVVRVGGLAVHSLSSFDVIEVEIDATSESVMRENAVELPVTKSIYSDCKDVYGDGSLKIYSLLSGYAGRSYAVENNTHLPQYGRKDFFQVFYDFNDSKDVISSRGILTADITVAPGETEIAHHIFPSLDNGTFVVTCKRSHRRLTLEEQIEYKKNHPEIVDRLIKKGLLNH